MKKLLSLAISMSMALGALLSVAPAASAATLVPLVQVQSGDLIRGQSFPAVYYVGKDGFRYVFPNDKTYFTWYTNFDTVKWISDVDLAKIQIGGNVTYRPGVKLLKINTDPKTYAVGAGGSLRWVTTEQIAVSLYGANWNKTMVDDVPDAFFGNYKIGGEINNANEFVPMEVTAQSPNINEDKDLETAIVVNINDSGYQGTPITVQGRRAVRFTNVGTTKHTATADDLTWGTGTLNPGESFQRYFGPTVGEYTFFCSYHPEMKGKIVVQ
jgi:plastocyanin